MHTCYAFQFDIKKTPFSFKSKLMIEILILSFVQGVTEFLPVSSSSHLIIISEYLNFQNQNLSIDISMHIGSFAAVICFFHKDIFNFIENKDLLIKILVSSIPVMVVGFFLIQTNTIENIRSIKVIGWMTIIFGILLYFSDKFNVKNNIKKNFNFKSALIIGLFQILSLIPGVSRSGITISAGRILNFSRYESAKISFLLSIPTLGAVSIFGISKIITSNESGLYNINILSIILSFIFSIVTIKYFLKYTKKFSLNLFVIYRVFLGSILLYLSYL